MITIKRQIENEKERYGGFADTEPRSEVMTEREINEDLLTMRSYTEKPTSAAVERTAPPEEAKAVPAPERVKATEQHSDAKMHDIVRREEKKDAAQVSEVAVREKKLSPTTKRAVIVYMSIVLSLVLAVIITGICISAVNSQISALETTIENQQERLLAQSEVLAEPIDEEEIRQSAEQMGMVSVEEGEINGYGGLEYQQNTEEDNGVFDSVRDWLNSVFGG